MAISSSSSLLRQCVFILHFAFRKENRMEPKLPLFFIVNSKPETASLSIKAKGDDGCDALGGQKQEGFWLAGGERPVAGEIRLDAALGQVFSEMGVRGRRRFWEWCAVTVNGKPRPAGYMVKNGDEIGIVPLNKEHGGGARGVVISRAEPTHSETRPNTASQNIASQDTISRGAACQGTVPQESAGACVSWRTDANPQKASENTLEVWLERIRLVAMTADYLVFYKPSGLHTAHVAGAGSVSLEACLPKFMERHGRALERVCLQQGGGNEGAMDEGEIDRGGNVKGGTSGGQTTKGKITKRGVAKGQIKQPKGEESGATFVSDGHMGFPCPLLLTRLDFETSGLVLAARNAWAQKNFRQLEVEGKVEKTYLAVAWGEVGKGTVKNALNMSNRRQTTVLSGEGEVTRWTTYEGLGRMDKTGLMNQKLAKESALPDRGDQAREEAISLVKVTIHRGARHQIRAHLAFIGHPLVQDELYGGSARAASSLPSFASGPGHFFLHYGRLRMPGLTAWALPDSHWEQWRPYMLPSSEGQSFKKLLMGGEEAF